MRSSRNRVRATTGLPARDAATGVEAAAAPDTVAPVGVEGPSAAVAGGEPESAAEL
jgi:hypothetical protein